MCDILSLVVDVIELPADREKLIDGFVDAIVDDIAMDYLLKRGTPRYSMVRDDIHDTIHTIVEKSTVQWLASRHLDAIMIVARESAKMTMEQRFADGTDILVFMNNDRRFDKYTVQEKCDIITVSHIPMQMAIDSMNISEGDP